MLARAAKPPGKRKQTAKSSETAIEGERGEGSSNPPSDGEEAATASASDVATDSESEDGDDGEKEVQAIVSGKLGGGTGEAKARSAEPAPPPERNGLLSTVPVMPKAWDGLNLKLLRREPEKPAEVVVQEIPSKDQEALVESGTDEEEERPVQSAATTGDTKPRRRRRKKPQSSDASNPGSSTTPGKSGAFRFVGTHSIDRDAC